MGLLNNNIAVVPRPIRTGRMHFMCSQAEYWTVLDVQRSTGLKQALQNGVKLPMPPELNMASGESAVTARVDNNRWIADCECGGAEFVWLEEPWFMCQNCYNYQVNGLWRPVTLPHNLIQIEIALRPRPMPQNRNWFPHESVDDLLAENQEHGL